MELSVRIDSLSFGGCGVGRVSGKVVFVPYSVPGDELRIEMTKEEKGHFEGRILEILSPSAVRREPACPYHSICGGCHWLHIPYIDQENAKEQIFKDTLRRIGRVDSSIVQPISPSPLEFNYRSRVQFKVWEGKIGFYRRESHDLVDVMECPLAHPLINGILKGLRQVWPDSIRSVSRVDINVSPSEANGIVSLYLKERSNFDFNELFKALNTGLREVTGLIIHYRREVRIYGSGCLFSQEGTFRFRASEGSFSQVNYRQNMNMKDHVLSLASLKGTERVVELYSGGGNFTVPLASRAGMVIGIEASESSVKDGIENARINDIRNATFRKATAENGLQEMQNQKFKIQNVDLVVVDPPRDGCSRKVIEGIASLKPGRIIYVSCNPSTLARDLIRFQSLGYEAVSSKPFDMFPQTFHIESVTEIVSSS